MGEEAGEQEDSLAFQHRPQQHGPEAVSLDERGKIEVPSRAHGSAADQGRAGPELGARAIILRRARQIHAERIGRVPAPARIVEDGAGERDLVGVAARQDLLGLLRATIMPTARVVMPVLRFTSAARWTW